MTPPPTSLPPVPSRAQALEEHRARGGAIAAVFPIHGPRPLLLAHGLLPVEVWGPPGADVTLGDAHLPSWTCSIVRCGLSALLGSTLDRAQVVVVPHTCDALQGLGGLFAPGPDGGTFLPTRGRTFLPFYLPRGGGETLFLAEELRHLSESLSALSGRHPSAEELMGCITEEEAADAALIRLLDARPRLSVDDRVFYALARSRGYLPPETFASLVAQVLGSLAGAPADAPGQPGLPLLLSGIAPEPMDLLEALQAAGAWVAADDLACTGRRRYPAGTSTDPWVRMAERILGAPPCSTRGSSLEERLAWVVGLARDRGVKGAVLYHLQFCEPELFYAPDLRRALEAERIPTLVLEGDIHLPLSRQNHTRVQAFVEMLR